MTAMNNVNKGLQQTPGLHTMPYRSPAGAPGERAQYEMAKSGAEEIWHQFFHYRQIPRLSHKNQHRP